MQELYEGVSMIIASLGGAAVVILGLCNWLGKVWANRLMQSEKAAFEKQLEGIRAKEVRSLELEKAQHQRELEDFKAKLSREAEYKAQLFREKLSLYKDAVEPIVKIIASWGEDKTRTEGLINTFEKKDWRQSPRWACLPRCLLLKGTTTSSITS